MTGATGLSCSKCGGPLEPPLEASRVDCRYCGTPNELASAGAVKVAKVLEGHGIRVPEKPRALADIEEELAARDAQREKERHTAIALAAVLCIVVATVVAIAVLGGG
jgi:hypothetical protein